MAVTQSAAMKSMLSVAIVAAVLGGCTDDPQTPDTAADMHVNGIGFLIAGHG